MLERLFTSRMLYGLFVHNCNNTEIKSFLVTVLDIKG